VTRKIIDAEDFCLFVKNHGRAVIGNRLSYEGLAFVRDYVFPRPHADLLSVRGPYGRGKKPAQAYEAVLHDEDDGVVPNGNSVKALMHGALPLEIGAGVDREGGSQQPPRVEKSF